MARKRVYRDVGPHIHCILDILEFRVQQAWVERAGLAKDMVWHSSHNAWEWDEPGRYFNVLMAL